MTLEIEPSPALGIFFQRVGLGFFAFSESKTCVVKVIIGVAGVDQKYV